MATYQIIIDGTFRALTAESDDLAIVEAERSHSGFEVTLRRDGVRIARLQHLRASDCEHAWRSGQARGGEGASISFTSTCEHCGQLRGETWWPIVAGYRECAISYDEEIYWAGRTASPDRVA